MSLEEQVHQYKTIAKQIDELEAQKKELSLAILQQMKQKTVTLSKYIVRRYERLSYRTPIETAREFNATKMEEVLDKDKLKQMHQSGHAVPGVTQSTFILVSLPKEQQDSQPVE
jgi:predicted phage-related endonuclease